MAPTERNGGQHVEFFVRDRLPTPASRQRERIVGQLAKLEAEGHVTSFEVNTWDRRIEREDPVKTTARDRFNDFVAWANERGVSLRPFFGTRECYSMETGERGEWIVFPALCLAVYEDGELASVYPHADGETYRSVSDGLDALDDSSEPADDTTDERERAPVGLAD